MARSVTFIHASDLHLGAPFRGLRGVSPLWADKLVRAVPEAYGRIIDAAIERAVDFVVIAGDVFDDARASYSDYRCFLEGLERLDDAGIASYVCTGNHDPYATWVAEYGALPPGAVMFCADHPSFALFERDGEPLCVLGGRGYPNSVWAEGESIACGCTRAAAEEELGTRAQSAPFGVGVLHAGLHLDMKKAPVEPAELYRAGFDYWALGHIHARWLDSETDPRISFSGCIQGRDIKETGRRGVNLVTLEEGAPNRVEFIPTASVVWEHPHVDVSACESVTQMRSAIMAAQFEINGNTQCETMVTRVTLVGATPLHDVLARPGVVEDLRSAVNDSYADFFVDAIVDKTTRPRDLEALAREGMFPATLMRTARRLESDPAAVTAYLEAEFMARGVPLPDYPLPDKDKLVREAADLVLDMLVGDDAS